MFQECRRNRHLLKKQGKLLITCPYKSKPNVRMTTSPPHISQVSVPELWRWIVISLELFTKISPSQDSDRQPEKHNPRATAFASIIKMSINASSHNVEEREETFLDSHRESVGSILGTNSSRFHGNLSSKTKQLTNGHGNRSQWTRSESAKLWSPSWLDAEQRNQSAH